MYHHVKNPLVQKSEICQKCHLHFCRWMYGSIFIHFLQWAPKDACFLHQSAFWPFKVPIESAYATSYRLVGHSNYGLHRF